MKIASVLVDEMPCYGMVSGSTLQIPGDVFLETFPSLKSVLESNSKLTADVFDGAQFDMANVRFLPVIDRPDKILCVGVNYRPHIEEMGRDVPQHPVVFMRSPSSLIGHEAPIVKPLISDQYDYEGELAIIIGQRVRYASVEDAMEAVFGFTCFMDGSVRDWQRHTSQFTAGKNSPASGSIGPWVVTKDEISAPSEMSLQTRVNGNVVQRGRIADLVLAIPRIIAYCSSSNELLPGDVIATGTPGGVGAAQRPPRWLNAGDTVVVDIDQIGELHNSVQDERSITEA